MLTVFIAYPFFFLFAHSLEETLIPLSLYLLFILQLILEVWLSYQLGYSVASCIVIHCLFLFSNITVFTYFCLHLIPISSHFLMCYETVSSLTLFIIHHLHLWGFILQSSRVLRTQPRSVRVPAFENWKSLWENWQSNICGQSDQTNSAPLREKHNHSTYCRERCYYVMK